jgi:hypothetical protein
MLKFFKKYHKWLGILITIFVLLFSVSGIILNHRDWFSASDVKRSFLPAEYQYHNWNLAAVKGSERIGEDSILIYGNIGIWLTDENLSNFSEFNTGFYRGVDNHKIEKVFKSDRNQIYAGSLFGLFLYDENKISWQKIFTPEHNPRIVDIAQKGDTLLVLSRSSLYKTVDNKNFTKFSIPEPIDYDNKIGLFKTLWVIHSGEIYGSIGKLFVDLMGLIFIFLSLTGMVYFVVPLILKRNKRNIDDRHRSLKKVNRWSLKWHNKIGWLTFVLLLLTTFTGMFLRPPLLALIASTKVDKIPFTQLDTPNPWFDKLRRIIVDEELNTIHIATLDGVFQSDLNFSGKLVKNKFQPPISVMGVNVFDKLDEENLLVGSFEGLFIWNHKTGYVYDAIKLETFKPNPNKRIPLGDFLVTGFSDDFNAGKVFFDFNSGASTITSEHEFIPMPLEISNQNMSLWNVALEVHTARMYKFMFGNLYILFIPLAGLIILFVQFSGFVVWFKVHRNKNKK